MCTEMIIPFFKMYPSTFSIHFYHHHIDQTYCGCKGSIIMKGLSIIILSIFMRRSNNEGHITFRDDLNISAKRRRDHRIMKGALRSSEIALVMFLLLKICEQSLVIVAGIDKIIFYFFLERTLPLYNTYSPYSLEGTIIIVRRSDSRLGNPHNLNEEQYSRLLLTWYRTRGL